ncbi:triacylglycerol lipase-like protein [Ramaria rubella]|nr:triacylglycerol lipase-like protein [Ramaria rubella]
MLYGKAYLLVCLWTASLHAAASPASHPIAPTVDLGYATYEGMAQSNGQNQFLGIRFAAAPLGNLRFRKPQPPAKTPGVQQAKAFSPVCFGVAQGLSDSLSEDCLFLNVWAPSEASPTSKLPVFFWIQGGGYDVDSNANYNGSELVQATGNQMVFVNINYRVGPFGFLSSEKVRENGDLNVGLLDQRFALEWVQEHITKFGGNPDQVVIVGDSAGAGSVAMHLVAFGGQATNLFAGGFGVSPFFPTQFRVSELEWQFDLYASRAGCDGKNDPLSCLRAQNSTVLQNANAAMSLPGRNNSAIFPFTPAIDGEFLVDFPYTLFEEGRFVKVPVVFGDDTNEGTIFATNAASPADVASFLLDQFPQLSVADTDAINFLYPLQAPLAEHAAFFPSAAAAYGETTFICPGIEISSALAKHTKSWNYRYNVLTPTEIASGLGVSHVSELPNVFGPGNTPAGSSTSGFDFDDISLTPILQAYYTSFVRALDPNAHPVEGSVFWPEFTDNQRLLLQVNSTQLEAVPQSQLDRCAFWKGLAVKMEQ